MIGPKGDSRPPGRTRYPGARPFSDSPEDRQVFFGRDADIDRLFERVLGARLLVLFGKSGLGKTSLLMAGVFPRLREKPFLPVPVRLNRAGSPTDIILAALTDACKRAGVELAAGDAGGVWEFLRTSLIWDDDLLLTPVLVFDQFEEIFTLRDVDFRTALAAELGALASGIPPERLRTSERHRAERGARLGEQPPAVRILLSLREEYLGTLQDLSGAIPGLFQERVRLAPLGEEDARLAICRPAACREEPEDKRFETPPFEYEEDALVGMLAFLRGESRIIEPFQLQLLCCRAEELVAARAREARAKGSAALGAERPAAPATAESGQGPPMIRITSADLGGAPGMEAVLKHFYRRVIGLLGWRDRRRARRLCEEGLLSATGSRLMLDQTQIESDYGMRAAALATLVDERLLRREQRLESLFYEISHDRLAYSIERSRQFRIPKKFRLALRGAAAVALLTIVVLIMGIVGVEQERKAADRARSDAEDLVAFLIGESLLEKLRPVGRNAILEEVQGQVQAYLDKSPPPEGGPLGQPRQLRARGLALRNAGDILRSRGKLGEALVKFQDSAEVFERLAAVAPGPEPEAERARALDRLGDALLDQGKITQALKTHREALALRQTLHDGDRSAGTSLDLADSNNAVGRVLNDMGRPRQALVHLDRARDLLRAIEPSSHSPRVLKARHDAVDGRADSLKLIGDASAAREAYADALQITQEWLQRYPLSADARVRQISSVARLANEQMDRGAVAKALEQYDQINRAVDELVRWDDSNALWKRDFAATLILMAEARSAVKQVQEAQKAYDAALERLEGLAETDPSNNRLKKDLYWLYQSRGRLALERKEWNRATADFTASERYIAEAARVDGAFATWQRDWSWVLFDLARARSGAREHEEAVAFLRRGRDLASALTRAAPEAAVFQEDLVIFYGQEVRALEDGGKRDEAAAVARERERAVMEALAAQPRNAMLLNRAHLEYLRDGDEMKAAGRLDDAVAAYRKGVANVARTVELEPANVDWWTNLRDAHQRVGDTLYQGKRWVDAEAAYRNGIGPAEKACAIAPRRADLANAVFLLRLAVGDTLKAEGRQESALSEFERAREWIQKASEIDGTFSIYFDNRRALYMRVAQIKAALKDVDGARTAYSAAAAAGGRAVELAEAPDRKAEFANNVYLLYVDEGDWSRGRDDQAAALQHYDAARAWIERAMAAAPGRSLYAEHLGILNLRIGTTKQTLGDSTGAGTAFRASIEAVERSESLAGAKGEALQKARRANHLYRAHEALAELLESHGDAAGALISYGRALASLKRAAGLDAKDAAYPDSMRVVYRQIARLKADAGDTTGAGDDLRAAAEAGQRAAALGKSAYYLNRSGEGLFALGAFYERAESLDKAQLAYDDAAGQVERAIKLRADSDLYYQNLSTARRRVGELLGRSSDSATAGAAFDAAVRAGRRATELGSSDGRNWQVLYQAQWSLATLTERRGDSMGALRQLREALKSAEQAASLLQEDRTASEDVTVLRGLVTERSR